MIKSCIQEANQKRFSNSSASAQPCSAPKCHAYDKPITTGLQNCRRALSRQGRLANQKRASTSGELVGHNVTVPSGTSQSKAAPKQIVQSYPTFKNTGEVQMRQPKPWAVLTLIPGFITSGCCRKV